MMVALIDCYAEEGIIAGIFTILTHNINTNHDLANTIIGLMAHFLNYREDCLAFWRMFPPLLIGRSLSCSVASLSLCPEP